LLHATFQIIQTIPTIQLQCIEHNWLFFIILTHHISNQSSAASCIQLSSPSISNDTLFLWASLQTKSKRATTLSHSSCSSAVNFFFFSNFHTMQNVQPCWLKTANGIDSRSLAKSMVLRSFSLQYQTDAHPLFLPLNNQYRRNSFCMHFINYR
jgi:hypothetical protein